MGLKSIQQYNYNASDVTIVTSSTGVIVDNIGHTVTSHTLHKLSGQNLSDSVAQLVEHQAGYLGVLCSSPGRAGRFYSYITLLFLPSGFKLSEVLS